MFHLCVSGTMTTHAIWNHTALFERELGTPPRHTGVFAAHFGTAYESMPAKGLLLGIPYRTLPSKYPPPIPGPRVVQLLTGDECRRGSGTFRIIFSLSEKVLFFLLASFLENKIIVFFFYFHFSLLYKYTFGTHVFPLFILPFLGVSPMESQINSSSP